MSWSKTKGVKSDRRRNEPESQKNPTKEPKIRTARNFNQLTQTQYLSHKDELVQKAKSEQINGISHVTASLMQHICNVF